MPEGQIFPVSDTVARNAWIDAAKYEAMYGRSVDDPEGFWGEHGKRLDWIKPFTKVKDVGFDGDVSHPLVRGRHAQRRPPTASTATSPTRGDQTAIIWEGDDPERSPAHHLPRAARAGLPPRQRAEGARRQEGRPRHHLPADDPRGGVRDARLRAHRRDPFGGVRRLLARQRSPAASRTATSDLVITADEGLRGGTQGPAQGAMSTRR